jgi:hypothetical protein
MAYWVIFESGKKGSLDPSQGDNIKELAESLGGPVKELWKIPYPAFPKLHIGRGTPDFCMSPVACKGRHSCPRSYACSE